MKRSRTHWIYGPITSTTPGGERRTKNGAWEGCLRAGETAGIPQHAWRKHHSERGWEWRASTRYPLSTGGE